MEIGQRMEALEGENCFLKLINYIEKRFCKIAFYRSIVFALEFHSLRKTFVSICKTWNKQTKSIWCFPIAKILQNVIYSNLQKWRIVSAFTRIKTIFNLCKMINGH